MKDLIEIDRLSKVYESGGERVLALSGIDLRIEQGSFVSVMGPSGSGKSTLLSVLGGLNSPTEGAVMVDGIAIYRLASEKLADFRNEYVGFVFQSFQLVPYLSVVENVMLPLAVAGLSNREQRAMAEDVLGRVGLGGKQRRLPDQLSGGEQERVAIARALVNSPPLLLADEPTGNLDSATGREIMRLFESLNAKGQTIVMVTHNRENAAYSTETVCLRDGRIEREIPPR